MWKSDGCPLFAVDDHEIFDELIELCVLGYEKEMPGIIEQIISRLPEMINPGFVNIVADAMIGFDYENWQIGIDRCFVRRMEQIVPPTPRR